jgi:hypothetical protein
VQEPGSQDLLAGVREIVRQFAGHQPDAVGLVPDRQFDPGDVGFIHLRSQSIAHRGDHKSVLGKAKSGAG